MPVARSIDYPPFPGIRPAGVAFLRQLKQHNERDWFKPRKDTFEDELQWPMRCLVVDAARRADHAGLPLTGDPKKSLFRIYRDTRFSKNKQPYKTHVSAVLSRSGTRKDQGVIYIHIEPDQCFLAAGFHRLDTNYLRPLRQRMVAHPALFFEMKQTLHDRGLQLETTDDKLKGMPRGHAQDKESDVAAYLRWKSFLVERPVDEADVQVPAFTTQVITFMQEALPLLRYGWDSETSTE